MDRIKVTFTRGELEALCLALDFAIEENDEYENAPLYGTLVSLYGRLMLDLNKE